MLSSLIFIALASFVTLAVILYAFQPQFVYFPSREVLSSPAQVGLEYESVTISTEDGLQLHGWFIPATQPRGVVLFFHGNAGNISHRLDSLTIFQELGLSTFIFDYRGYGQSQGKPSEQGTYRDAEAAWRYLTKERMIAADQIIYFGRSLGAAIATRLAVQHPPAALILESAFTSIHDLARRFYPWMPAGLLVRIRYPTVKLLPRVQAPLLIMHSSEDEIVPFSHAQRLHETARKRGSLVAIRGSHNEGFLQSGQTYIDELDRFLSSIPGNR